MHRIVIVMKYQVVTWAEISVKRFISNMPLTCVYVTYPVLYFKSISILVTYMEVCGQNYKTSIINLVYLMSLPVPVSSPISYSQPLFETHFQQYSPYILYSGTESVQQR